MAPLPECAPGTDVRELFLSGGPLCAALDNGSLSKRATSALQPATPIVMSAAAIALNRERKPLELAADTMAYSLVHGSHWPRSATLQAGTNVSDRTRSRARHRPPRELHDGHPDGTGSGIDPFRVAL